MGMAASQARYLALVARQSNCEYEGQQINQARLVLANQSANLFNQMLGLSVPVPPSTQDFTRTQYSFNDGSHSYTIDSWKQLSVTDPDYNYIVNAHYFSDVYTGSMKRMADPQVQISNDGSGSIASISQIEAAITQLRLAQDIMDQRQNYYLNVKQENESRIEALRREAGSSEQLGYRSISSISSISGGTPPTLPSQSVDYTLSDGTNSYNVTIYGSEYDFINVDSGDCREVLDGLINLVNLGIMDLETINNKMRDRIGPVNINEITDIEELSNDQKKQLLKTFALAKDGANHFIVLAEDIDDMTEVAEETPAALNGYKVSDDLIEDEPPFNGANYYNAEISYCNGLITSAHTAYLNAKTNYDNYLAAYRALAQPTYIGNCPLTYLDTLSEDEEIELRQVVSDMIAQDIDTDIINCFNQNEEYTGGVYKFTMYGVTYYTTYKNLCDAYASNHLSNNFIDEQYRMPYYNASYISTRVDQQGKALLETDGNGRFTSIRFENDSATYVLNMETITDEDAYSDAMNQYYYENAQYDKMVQDINAKTSIIQHEDKELELRLKQLETERNALKTETEAVQKIIKDNVESSFKTFGG